MKSPKHVHGKAPCDDEEGEDALEMERNFVLFSKRGHVPKSEMTEKDKEETSDEESNEEIEDADEETKNSEDFVKEHDQAERVDAAGSRLHTKTECNRGETVSAGAIH